MERELTYYEIIELVKNVNFEPQRLNIYSIDVLEEWKTVMSMIPYDLHNGDMEISLTRRAIAQAIKMKNTPWNVEDVPAEDVKGKLLKIDNGNKGIKNRRELTKDDIDRMMVAAQEMIERDAVVKNGKVTMTKSTAISREEHVYRCTRIYELKEMLKGTKMLGASFWYTGNKSEVIGLIVRRSRDLETQNCCLAKELANDVPDTKKLSIIRTRIANIQRHIEALHGFIEYRNHIEQYDSERLQTAN